MTGPGFALAKSRANVPDVPKFPFAAGFSPMRYLVLLLALFASPVRSDDIDRFTRLGTALEYALPIAAGLCALGQNRSADYLAGLVVTQSVVNQLKENLGHAALNIRPDGTDRGFPSGHAALATFGATSLARKCYPEQRGLKLATYGLAALVGLSRITADRHNIWQVGAGAVIGYYANGLEVSVGPGEFGISYHLDF